MIALIVAVRPRVAGLDALAPNTRVSMTRMIALIVAVRPLVAVGHDACREPARDTPRDLRYDTCGQIAGIRRLCLLSKRGSEGS